MTNEEQVKLAVLSKMSADYREAINNEEKEQAELIESLMSLYRKDLINAYFDEGGEIVFSSNDKGEALAKQIGMAFEDSN